MPTVMIDRKDEAEGNTAVARWAIACLFVIEKNHDVCSGERFGC
jgi:hypothetical protein